MSCNQVEIPSITVISLQYYEMSYGLNVEMHKQTEIGKRLDAIIRQVLPFLSAEVGKENYCGVVRTGIV